MPGSAKKVLEKYLLNTLNELDPGNWHVTKHTLCPYITNDKTYVKIQAYEDTMVLLIFHRVKREVGEDIYTHDHVSDIPIAQHDKLVKILRRRVLSPRKPKHKLPHWWNNELITLKPRRSK